jgi:hypothetical protein
VGEGAYLPTLLFAPERHKIGVAVAENVKSLCKQLARCLCVAIDRSMLSFAERRRSTSSKNNLVLRKRKQRNCKRKEEGKSTQCAAIW